MLLERKGGHRTAEDRVGDTMLALVWSGRTRAVASKAFGDLMKLCWSLSCLHTPTRRHQCLGLPGQLERPGRPPYKLFGWGAAENCCALYQG